MSIETEYLFDALEEVLNLRRARKKHRKQVGEAYFCNVARFDWDEKILAAENKFDAAYTKYLKSKGVTLAK